MAIKTGVNTDWLDTSKAMPVAKSDHITRKWLNVPYGKGPLQQLDIFLPEEGEGPFPLIIDVHGGGLTGCDKHDFHLYPMFWALQQGFAAASINYRLSPAVKYPEHLYDVKRAVLFLFKHAEEYKVDRNNFFLWGTSAGGNLVLMAGLKKGLPLPEDIRAANDVPIRAAAGISAATGLDKWGKGGKSLQERIMLKLMTIGLYEKVLGIKKPTVEQLKQSDPTSYLSDGTVPLYLQHGDMDGAVPIEAMLKYAEIAKAVLPAEDLVVDIIPGAKHAGDGPEFLKEEHTLPILKFFRNHTV